MDVIFLFCARYYEFISVVFELRCQALIENRGGKPMCGIIGYTGTEDAVPIILDGLKRLEYRGYDSSGVAIMGSDGFEVVKQKGRLSALEESISRNPIEGFTGIGHTRWATHGEPSDINSHPHLGS